MIKEIRFLNQIFEKKYDLWILGNPKSHQISSFVDWLLNYNLSVFDFKTPPKWDKSLKKIIENEQLPLKEKVLAPQKQLLSITNGRVPGDFIIRNDEQGKSFEEWVTSSLDSGKSLDVKDVLLILPDRYFSEKIYIDSYFNQLSSSNYNYENIHWTLQQ